jgi:F-type H+-transporting ATPase subunit b
MKRIAIFLFLFAVALNAQEKAVPEENMTWKWVNFAILAIGLGYLCAKMFPPFFKSRTAEIQQGIREAQAIKSEAEKRAAEMQARMAALGAEIEKFRAQSGKEMEQEGKRIGEETARQVARLQAQAEVEIEMAGKIARRELQAYAAKLAIDLAEQRLQTQLDPSIDALLINDFVADLEASKN